MTIGHYYKFEHLSRMQLRYFKILTFVNSKNVT